MTTAIVLPSHWRGFLDLKRLDDGWWLKAELLTPCTPLWGPYATRAEALEARRSFLRNAIEKPWLAKRKAKGRK